jgi:hypothetical protein
MRRIVAICISLLLPAVAHSQIPELVYYWWGDRAQLNASGMQPVCLVASSPTTCISWTSWIPDVSAAASEYINKTKMVGGLGPNGEGLIVVVNNNWANIPYTGAAATVLSSGVQCITWQGVHPVVNNNCNKTTHRPVSAYVYLNSAFFDHRYEPDASWYWSNFRLRVILHEFGHVLGMDHNNNPLLNSFMQDPMHDLMSTSLHGDEITWINAVL